MSDQTSPSLGGVRWDAENEQETNTEGLSRRVLHFKRKLPIFDISATKKGEDMRVFLEVFFTKIAEGEIQYKRRLREIVENFSDPDSSDPDKIVQKIMDEEFGEGIAERRKFVRRITHSPSWRHEWSEGRVFVVTYIAYSDEFQFRPGETKKIALAECSFDYCAHPPRSAADNTIVEEALIAHALRHLGFLVQTDEDGVYREAIGRSALDFLSHIPIGLAGKVPGQLS